MKKSCFSIFIIAVTLLSCEKQVINNEDKELAKKLLDESKPIVLEWLNKYNELGPEYIKKIESMDFSSNNLNDASKQQLIQIINEQYGILNNRSMLGAHIWTGDKLVTWGENIKKEDLEYVKLTISEDNFYNIDPKYFGFLKSSDMVRGYPKGQYVIYLFNIEPTKKNHAEESVTLWRNKNGNWKVVRYRIAEDL